MIDNMSYNSTYTGAEVQVILDSVAEKQDAIPDLDVIRAGAAKGATALQEHQDISGKVDKVEGKGLSTEDFTTTLKAKLESLKNYDDTAIQKAVSELQTQLDTLVEGNASSAIESFNEIIAFLNGLEDSQSLDSIIASIEQQIASKLSKEEADSTYATKTELETRNAGMAETSEEVEDVESEFATKGYVNSAIIGAINKEY